MRYLYCFILWLWLAAHGFAPGDQLWSQERSNSGQPDSHLVVLRNQELIRGRVVKLSDEGVQWADGKRTGWEIVKEGRIDSKRQVRFDALVASIGLPRHRFLERVQLGCWQEAMKVVKSLPEPVSSSWAFRIQCVQYHGYLEQGKIEEAAFAFAQANALTAQLSDTERKEWVREDWAEEVLQAELLSPQILPLFYDRKKSKEMLGRLATAKVSNSPRMLIYGIGWAVASRSWKQADQFLQALDDKSSQGWKPLLRYWIELEKSGAKRTVGIQSIGTSLNKAQQRFVLWLDLIESENEKRNPPRIAAHLRVAAICQEEYPAVTAAALYRAFKLLSPSSADAAKLRAELEKSHKSSYHFRLLNSESGG